MILHALIVDDEEEVLESLVPGFVRDLAERLAADPGFQEANREAGGPFPASGRLNVKLSAVGYPSVRASRYSFHRPAHVHLHLCCEKTGSFRVALRLLREQFFSVVVSDLRFSDDTAGSRAGRFFIEDVLRRNPETFGVLYSAYQKPDGFPADRFVRKGAASDRGGDELLDKMVEGFRRHLAEPSIRGFVRELGRRGIVYQSDAFGATLRQAYDLARFYFGFGEADSSSRRRPRPMILIDGETGTGKTELAGLIHAASDRRAHPFLTASCSQLSDEQLLRSALFGHVRGAFTGAAQDRTGLIDAVGRGVLLLDDLHKLSDGASLILHSFLDDGEFARLGEDEKRRFGECAVLGAVETPRWEEIKANGELSESFIHRVEQLVLRVPPLAARPEDVEHQARHYVKSFSRSIGQEMQISEEAVAWLVDFGFPGGNTRKLRDFLKGVAARCARTTDYVDVVDLEEYARESRLMLRKGAPRSPGAAPAPPAGGAASAAWRALQESSTWQGRVARLTVTALVEELQLDDAEAERVGRELMESDFPKLWSAFEAVRRRSGVERPMEIKLFDELVRYYAVYRCGNPAKAARELGMKDNALREFIYSREQKREIAGDDG
jgi:DNA-binding NtrC family response regulator